MIRIRGRMNPDDFSLEIPEELLTQVAGGMRESQELVLRTLMRSANHHEPGVEKSYFIGFRCVIY